ncbi:MAG: alpha/beta fold hydrolase [Cytophagales bacterium]|nr:alpha/beta fold hydrolase [Cytophagales bacterium]
MKKVLWLLAALVTLAARPVRAQIDTTVQRVLVPGDGVQLDGLLILPRQAAKPAPAVIWLGGSGSWDMIGNYPNEPDIFYRHYLEPTLLAKGFAILYLNKRGMGRSTGRWQRQDFRGRADDANAAFRYLAGLPRVDPRAIGLVGHSQGGWVAHLAAARNPAVAFTVSLCGPTIDVYTQTIHSYQRQYQCQGLTSKQLRRKLRWKKRELAAGAVVGRVFQGGETGHWARIRRYTHDQALRGLKTPSLLVFAERDAYVWPDHNLAHLRQLFPDGLPPHLQTYVLPGGEHMLHVVPDGCVLDWNTLNQYPYSEPLRQYLATWIAQALPI